MTSFEYIPERDLMLTFLYTKLDDAFPEQVMGRPRQTTDAELVCIALAGALAGQTSERRWLRRARREVGHLFPSIPSGAQYNKRLRALVEMFKLAIDLLALEYPDFEQALLLLDTTPISCGRSLTTIQHSDLAGTAKRGFCAAYERYYWGFKLVYLCTPEGFPVAYELVPANTDDRDALRVLLGLAKIEGRIIIADRGFRDQKLEAEIIELGGVLLRPSFRKEKLKHPDLKRVRQWVESVFATLKGQLTLEQHGGRTIAGVSTRVIQRICALSAALWFNNLCGQPGRHLTAYEG